MVLRQPGPRDRAERRPGAQHIPTDHSGLSTSIPRSGPARSRRSPTRPDAASPRSNRAAIGSSPGPGSSAGWRSPRMTCRSSRTCWPVAGRCPGSTIDTDLRWALFAALVRAGRVGPARDRRRARPRPDHGRRGERGRRAGRAADPGGQGVGVVGRGRADRPAEPYPGLDHRRPVQLGLDRPRLRPARAARPAGALRRAVLRGAGRGVADADPRDRAHDRLRPVPAAARRRPRPWPRPTRTSPRPTYRPGCGGSWSRRATTWFARCAPRPGTAPRSRRFRRARASLRDPWAWSRTWRGAGGTLDGPDG